jgi:DNA-binding transcriptional ArsR family regulator
MVVSTSAVQVLSDAGRVAKALPLVRRQMLHLLTEPDSAAGLARRLELPRQRVNYHLRELERAGLVELVDQRRRRGLMERRLRTSARAYLVDPALLGALGGEPATARDRFSSAHLVATAARLIGDVAILRERAETAGQRLATLTIETEVAFGSPRDLRAFATDLQSALVELAGRYHRPGGRRHRFVVASHPVVTKTEEDAAVEASSPQPEERR